MKLLKTIITIAFAIIFIVATLVTLFGSGRVVNQLVRFALDVLPETCDYERPMPVKDEYVPPVCKPDVRRAKEEIAEGLGMALVGLPTALIFWRRIKAEKKEAE